MCAKWLNGTVPEHVVARLESARIKTGNQAGALGFPTALEIATTLLSFVEFRESLPECEQIQIINTAMHAAAKRGEITSPKLMAEVCKAENSFLARSEVPYVVVTSISVKHSKHLTSRAFPAATVSFARSLPKCFARNEVSERVRDYLLADEPASYTWILAKTQGRSFADAFSRAMEAIELLRGIWNFHYNLRKGGHITFSGTQKPVNEIRLGPLHTLHLPDGKLAVEGVWWWEPGYAGPEKPKDLDKDWEALHKDEKWILRRLLVSPFRQILAEAFRRYTTALDERSLQNGFLQLWSLLESLTGTQNANYSQTVRRAAFLYHERDYHLQILTHLRERRNRTIHKGQTQADDETILYQMKRYCEQMMRFILRARRLTTFQEYCDFLDTPTSADLLGYRLRLYKQSRKFRTSKPPRLTQKVAGGGTAPKKFVALPRPEPPETSGIDSQTL
jgi:hypothetical protein